MLNDFDSMLSEAGRGTGFQSQNKFPANEESILPGKDGLTVKKHARTSQSIVP